MRVKSKDRASAQRKRPTFRSRHRASSSLDTVHLFSLHLLLPHSPTLVMADDTAMGSLLAAVAVAAATSTTNSQSHHRPPASPQPPVQSNPVQPNPIPNKLAPIDIPKHPPSSSSPALPPPPPPLPPPLPSPPPLPPVVIRKSHPQLPSLAVDVNVTTNHPFPSSPSADKKKGARIFSANEKTILEANYARNKFPSRLHMETLANAMAKPTEKVRTWYNNRRALDRKLGFNVNRNHFYHPSPPSTHPIILPPTQPPSPPTEKPSFQTPSPVPVPRPPPISPLTNPRNSQLPSSPSPPPSNPPSLNPPPKPRTSPLRIRNVSLCIGSNLICGEIPDKPAADTGLEVKFLFGKKRIAYEWYCGLKYSDAQNTGGPYAKMEMNFATITAIHVLPSPPNTLITFTFSAFPTLFLQTHESMTKYRVRAQQRQYRKVSHQEFPIPVSIQQHTISLHSDDAARVLKLLREEPTAVSFHISGQVQSTHCATAADSIPHISAAAKKDIKPHLAPETVHLSEPCASPATSVRASAGASGHPLSGRKGSFALQNRHVPETKIVTGTNVELQHENAMAPSAPPPQVVDDIAGQTSSYSPVTPAALNAASKGNTLWLTPCTSGFRHTSGHNVPSGNQASPDGAVGQVRRELDFERTPRQSESHPRVGEKRSTPATPFDEVCPNMKTRPKVEGWEPSPGALPTHTSSHNHAGRAAAPKRELRDTRPPTLRDDGRPYVVDSQSILRVLPR